MRERQRRLSSAEMAWAFAGLRKCVMELQNCAEQRADDILATMEQMTTQEVYAVLQEW
jgi:hypothetical protein